MKSKNIILGLGSLLWAFCSLTGATYNIVNYGAVPDDGLDDTVAVKGAIEAARAAGGGTVYFPEGEYVVSPSGQAVVSVYRRSGGVWVSEGQSMQAGQIVSNWLFTTSRPVVSSGTSMALDIRSGRIYAWTGSGWQVSGSLLDGSGSGWYSGFEAPSVALGQDGDIYLKHYEAFDHLNAAAFELTPAHSHITFLGEGVGRSILSFKVWSGKDPMDYEVDTVTRTVIRAAIPRNSSGRYLRGSLFVMKQEGTGNFRNIEWDGLEMRGNTTASGKDSWYTPYDDLEEWDISNKGIVFSFGALSMYGLVVRNSSIHGWRGEILYKGGSNYAEILIENCDIYETNSSAVSISGNMIMRNVRIWNTYNGVENYCDEGQYSEIYNCDIDLDRSFRGHFGVVYLGTAGAHLKVIDSLINGAINGAIFLSDFAHNVEVTGNAISNSEWGLYLKYMNLYGLPGAFNNILVENNLFTASKYRFGHVIMNAAVGIPERDWVIRSNTVVSAGSPAWFFFRSDNATSRSEHNVVLSNNTLVDTTLFRGSGVVPVFDSNQSKPVEVNTWTATGGVYAFAPDNPEFVFTNVIQDGLQLSIGDLSRYPVGHRFTVRVMHPDSSRSLLLAPASWNTLTQSIRLVRGEEETFEMLSDGRFALASTVVVNPEPEPEPLVAPILTAVALDSSRIQLDWSATQVVDGYVLEEAVDGGTFQFLAEPAYGQVSLVVSGLDWRKHYTFRIKSRRTDMESDWGSSASVAPVEPDPVAPSGLVVLSVEPEHIGIAWEAVSDVEQYVLELSSDGTTFTVAAVLDSSHEQWISPVLSPDADYTIRIRSERNGLVSDWVYIGPIVPEALPEAPPVIVLPEAVHAWYFNGNSVEAGIDMGTGGLDLDTESVTLVDGLVGQGIYFSEEGSGLRIPDSSTLNRDLQDSLTLSIWFKPGPDALKRTSVLYEQGGYWRGLNVILEEGQVLASGWNIPDRESGWAGTYLTGPQCNIGEWNHVAVVLQGGPEVREEAFRLYVNGAFVASGSGSQIWKQNDSNGLGEVQKSTLYRGLQVRGLDPYVGVLDSVSIFHDTLDAAQIEELILSEFP